MTEIEPRIRPLTDALNQTGLLRTFSSCEGHVEPHEQRLTDRNHAYVQFVPAGGKGNEAVEAWLGSVLIRFKEKHGLLPVTVVGYKRYTPVEDAIEETFVLELRPFNRFDPPAQKRADIDRAIEQVRVLVDAA
ncbi:MAG: hypothetical protein H7319_08440 [Spirosoma sp.]|nr:hypothetical protein [Spirosoma sp.]